MTFTLTELFIFTVTIYAWALTLILPNNHWLNVMLRGFSTVLALAGTFISFQILSPLWVV